MSFKWKFDNSKDSMKKKDKKSEQVRDKVCRIFCIVSFTVCLIAFVLTSLAVFYNFIYGTTVISTSKPPNKLLELPIILLCNSSAYKEKDLNMSIDAFKKNTMNIDDALIEAFLVNMDKSILDNKLVSVMNEAKEVFTMTHGTCIMFDLKIKVINKIVLSIKIKVSNALILFVDNV